LFWAVNFKIAPKSIFNQWSEHICTMLKFYRRATGVAIAYWIHFCKSSGCARYFYGLNTYSAILLQKSKCLCQITPMNTVCWRRSCSNGVKGK
jgi:hypothetical protein